MPRARSAKLDGVFATVLFRFGEEMRLGAFKLCLITELLVGVIFNALRCMLPKIGLTPKAERRTTG